MANEAMETLLQKMSELTTAIKDSKQPKQELQWDDVQAQFGEQLKGLVAAQVKEKLDAQPNYRTPGAEVGAGGLPQIKASNRYGRMVKGLQKDGFHRIGNQKAKPVDLWLAGQMLQKANAVMPDRVNSPSEDLSEAIKALTSTGSGTGAELVDRQMAEMLWDDIFMSSRVVGAMANVPMPSNPFDLPLGLGSIRFRKGTQGAAVTGTNPATAKSTLTATELAAMVEWSYTLDEDAVVALMPEIRARLAQAGGEAIDGFALNADNTNAATGNINTDDAAPAADDYFLSDGQDGLRHLWLVDNTAQGVTGSAAALTDVMITNTLKTMGKYAASPDQLVMVTDVQTYLGGFLKTGSGAPGDYLITMDKLGPQAVVMTGQIGQYRGIPLILSESYGLTEADGKISTVTPANNVKGGLTVFNRRMWYSGFVRELLIEMDRDIKTRSYVLVASLRQAVAAHGTRSTAKHTAGLRDVLV